MRHGADARLALAAVLGKPIETFGGARAVLGQGHQSRFANINAKAEGIEGKPAFREAFQRPRSLVPVDFFYEWKNPGTGKQPSEDFESGRWPRSLGEPSRFSPTVRRASDIIFFHANVDTHHCGR